MHACVRGLAGVPCVSSTYGLTIDGEWLRQRLLGLDFVERALLLPPEMRVERAGMHSLTLEWSAPPTIPKFPVTGYCILARRRRGKGALWPPQWTGALKTVCLLTLELQWQSGGKRRI